MASRKELVEMMKLTVIMSLALSLAISEPAFARSPHKHQSRAAAYSGPVYDGWKRPYRLPVGVGPNDIPFAPF